MRQRISPRKVIAAPAVAQPDPVVTDRLDISVDESRQSGLDYLPEIEVLEPPRDEGPIGGIVNFAILAHDRDVGPTDGEGVAKVTFTILDTTVDPPGVIAAKEVAAPPYEWSFDTTSLVDFLYYLSVTVEASDGGVNEIWYRMLIDNYSPAR